MTPGQSARIVVIAAFVEAAFVLARAKKGGEPRATTVKSLWAIGVLTLGLAAFSDFAPQIAGPFAILVLVAMAARSRGELGQVLGTAAAGSAPGSSQTSSQGSGAEAPGFGPGR